MRTVPVVRVKAYINNYENIQDLDQKQCNSNTSCFNIDFCIELNDSNLNTIPLLSYSIEAEPTNVYSRVYFTETTTNKFNSTAQFIDSKKYCPSLGLIIKKDTYDFLTPIKFLLSYSFISNRSNISRLSLNEIDKHPIVHEDNNKFEFEVCKSFKLNIGNFNLISSKIG